MNDNHTYGVLRYEHEDGYCGELISANGVVVGAFVDEPSAEDARRLVACWNACEGISTENLENNLPVKTLAERYNEALRKAANLEDVLRAARVHINAGRESLIQCHTNLATGQLDAEGEAGAGEDGALLQWIDTALAGNGDVLGTPAPGAIVMLDEPHQVAGVDVQATGLYVTNAATARADELDEFALSPMPGKDPQ